MALNGVRRLAAFLGTDQEQEERSRHVPAATPLGDDEPEPRMNEDGSADVDLPEEELGDITELEDGSALVDLEKDKPAKDSERFDENLAESLDETELANLARDLLDDIDRDKEARKKRDEQYAEGIRRTGLGNEAPGGAMFEGASRAVHPVLIEGCVDFAARAMKELFPANGPVKAHILGKQTKAKLQRADRKVQYMNWQTTTQIKEYRRELEVLLTQLPLGGGQYLKVWYDERWERIRTEFVPIDDLLLPFEATSLGSAQRVTHVQRITRMQYEERVDSGMYREIPTVGDMVVTPERTESSEAAGQVEGVEDIGFNEDGLRVVYETQIALTLKKDPLAKRKLMPYILTVDEPTGKALALRRNWDEEDNDKAEALQWIVEYPFIPWRGAYPIGLTHLIGGLAGAATGALRALLDSAHINNMPGAIKMGGARVTGQTISVEPTQITNIEASVGIDDIRKLVMPLPFNPPSTVLFQLLGWLTDQAKGVVATAEERIADATSQMPVGTALALIEQGSITFSSIHSRLHFAQKETLSIIHRLDAKHLSDHEVVEDLGELVVSRGDFQGPMDIEPVSDPNIFSDAQRYAQLQAAMQLAAAAPPLYKQAELHKRALQLLKLPAPEEILNAPADPEELDPIEENVIASDPSKSVKAYEDQDHMDHLRSHLSFMTSPILAMNPLMGVPTLPVLLAHCKEHIVMLYGQHARAAMEAKATLKKARRMAPMPGGEADVLALVDQELAKLLGPLMPSLQQAQQMAQQMTQQQGPPDPRVMAAQMKKQSDDAALQQKTQADQARMQQEQQFEQARMAQATQFHQDDMRLQQLEMGIGQQRDQQASQLQSMLAQLEKMRADADRAMEAWQTKVEMSTANINAQMASQQADSDRQMKLVAQQMSDEAAAARERVSAQVELVLGIAQALQTTVKGTEGQSSTGIVSKGELQSAMNSLLENVQQLLLQRKRPSRLVVHHADDGSTEIRPVYDH